MVPPLLLFAQLQPPQLYERPIIQAQSFAAVPGREYEASRERFGDAEPAVFAVAAAGISGRYRPDTSVG